MRNRIPPVAHAADLGDGGDALRDLIEGVVEQKVVTLVGEVLLQPALVGVVEQQGVVVMIDPPGIEDGGAAGVADLAAAVAVDRMPDLRG